MSRKVALVTGANRGIGRAVAEAFGRLGMRVLVAVRNASAGETVVKEMRDAGCDAYLLVMEIVNESSVLDAAKEVERVHGRLDVLVNNAAMMDYDNHIAPLNLERMREEFDVNFFSSVNVTNAFLPLILRTSDAPRIVNVSTPLGTHQTVDNPTNMYASALFTSYRCTKAALNMYTHNLAKWLESGGDIAFEADATTLERMRVNARAAKVNAAYPGYVRTDMSRNSEEAPLSPAEGAETIVYLATLPHDGPTGGLFHNQERLSW
ncbi:short chain dehydrogenase KR domain [Trypanosoma vivax]|uniref:Putative short chain dehydrogenase n=1 Tax=Trypanosoma vivax (strain Y486) TaxID=1055687 RepID=G0TVA5_TRYVY|nr:putative short chain dehydrogenase [Trypanosoma vivax]KAH8613755.1 short chain dehydrogenase KR domain [Trypanosoma vivax]CCC47871.1 putative short chain dehydrogenase [Trypanosoma vivax Y486]